MDRFCVFRRMISKLLIILLQSLKIEDQKSLRQKILEEENADWSLLLKLALMTLKKYSWWLRRQRILWFVRYHVLKLLRSIFFYFLCFFIHFCFWAQAYRFNLKVLQNFDKLNFPLAKYIINVDRRVSSPSYLVENDWYWLSNGLPHNNPDVTFVETQVACLMHGTLPARLFGLNESQYEAFRAALTKQLVIIQGPPGTMFIIIYSWIFIINMFDIWM